MKKITNLILSIALLAFITVMAGCASTSHDSKFTADTIKQIKPGLTKTDVTGILGEPRSRLVDDAGDEVWQFRKTAEQYQSNKNFINAMSFGLNSRFDAEYQDVLTVTFKINIVSKVTYAENVQSPNPFASHN
jgi:outer membrane protein assembly factor BamE (lipoprotein component of BamABCDE complex)